MNRRTALKLGAPALLACAAGCSIPGTDNASGVAVSRITIRNRLDRDVPVSVLLTTAEVVAVWRTVTVRGAPDQFATVDDLPDGPGDYTLYARVPDTETGTAMRVDLSEEADGRSCLEVGLEIAGASQNGNGSPAVAGASISACDEGD